MMLPRKRESKTRLAATLLVAGTPVRDLLLCAKHLFIEAKVLAGPPASGRISTSAVSERSRTRSTKTAVSARIGNIP